MTRSAGDFLRQRPSQHLLRVPSKNKKSSSALNRTAPIKKVPDCLLAGALRLALSIKDHNRSKLLQDRLDLLRVADDDDLLCLRIDVLARDALHLIGGDGHDLRRVSL